MKKFKMILIILLGVILFIGLHSNSLSGQETNEVPKIFQLNPSLDFNKEEIKEWVDEYSWEKANSLTRKSHTRINEEELTYARFYTPIMFWVEKNFMGEQRFWSKEKIKKEYNSYVRKPEQSSYFMVAKMAANKASVKKENLKFVLKVGDKHWEASSVTLRELKEDQYYKAIFDIEFDFTDMEGHPEWSKWTLYLIRKDRLGRQEFVWDFN